MTDEGKTDEERWAEKDRHLAELVAQEQARHKAEDKEQARLEREQVLNLKWKSLSLQILEKLAERSYLIRQEHLKELERRAQLNYRWHALNNRRLELNAQLQQMWEAGGSRDDERDL